MPDTMETGSTKSNHEIENTIPKILLKNANFLSDQPAIRKKDLGIWQTWTWSEVAKEVRTLACALASIGFKRGDKLAIIGSNNPKLYWAMAAAQSLGGIPVPLYQDAVAKEIAVVLQDAEPRFAVVENQEQTDKLLESKDQCPFLEEIVYVYKRGMLHYDQPFLHSYEDFVNIGKEFEAENVDYYDQEVSKGSGEDIAIMLYTSGTTGKAKGVMLTYDNLMVTARNAIKFDNLTSADTAMAYLPMAWVGDNMISYVEGYLTGFCISCPESGDTLMSDLKEIGPTYFFAPPRVFEGILSQVSIRMEDASWLSRKLYAYFMGVARRAGVKILNKESVSILDRFLYKIGGIIIYEPLKNALGLSKIRVAYTGGEAIGPDLFEFFRSLNINLKQLYGQTEASVYVCSQPDGQVNSETVGIPIDGVEMKITDKGEVLYRSPGVFHSYYNNPEATAETKTADGWVKTGDAGVIDKSGQLKIIDRAKDIGQLNDGTLFAPKYIENKLKFFSFIQEVVVFGTGKDYTTAFINIDLDAVGNWAERKNLSYSGYTDLAAKEGVYTLIRECIEKVNHDLAEDEKLCNSQIKRFIILHKELDADDGELTRTRKVRRGTINERYEVLIDTLFSDRDSCEFSSEVTFEDGRTGVLDAKLKVGEVARFNLQNLKGAA